MSYGRMSFTFEAMVKKNFEKLGVFESQKCICSTADFNDFVIEGKGIIDSEKFNEYFTTDFKLDIPLEWLSNKTKEEAYREGLTNYTFEDAMAVLIQNPNMEGYSDEQLRAIAEKVATAYAENGDYDCNLSYWDNIDNLIDEYTREYTDEQNDRDLDL